MTDQIFAIEQHKQINYVVSYNVGWLVISRSMEPSQFHLSNHAGARFEPANFFQSITRYMAAIRSESVITGLKEVFQKGLSSFLSGTICTSVLAGDKNDHVLGYRRTNTLFLCALVLLLLTTCIGLNLYEGRTHFLPPLCAAAIVPVLSLAWLWRNQAGERLIPLALTGALFLLTLYLFFIQNSPDDSSLYWFIAFPLVFMLGLGLRAGTIMFLIFYCFLLFLFLTPLRASLLPDITDPASARFLLALLASFIFSWCGEYLRERTHQALLLAVSTFEQQSLTDPLTGLGNRRNFDNNFQWIVAKSVRDRNPFALALIDIDHFKRINDQFGHDVGDLALRHVATALCARMRATDRLFRWGGEEFIMLMPDSGLESARLVAQRLRRYVEKTPFIWNGREITCTVSIGLYAGQGDLSLNAPLFQADQNLYTAKNTGRNRVIG